MALAEGPSTTDRLRRRVALGVVLVALALAGVASVSVRNNRAQGAQAPIDPVGAVVVSHQASSSAWYCPGPLPIGTGNHAEIELANASGHAVRGSLDLVSSAGGGHAMAVVLGPHQVLTTALSGSAKSDWGAATVLLNGLGVGVAELEQGPSGPVSTPCVTSVASTSYLAGGTTRAAGNVALGLFDPGATPAVASVSVATNSGTLQPPAFQGVPVAAGQLVVLNVGQYVPQQQAVATTVSSSGGRLVVGALYSNVEANAHNLALVTGIPTAMSSWYFAPAPSGGSAAQSFSVLNTSTRPATVELQSGGASTGTAVARTVVAPGATAAIGIARDPGPGSLRWARLVAAGGAGVVVERGLVLPKPLNRSQKAGAAVFSLPDPVPAGQSSTSGTPALARAWLLAGGANDASAGEVVSVGNLSTKRVVLRLAALDAPAAVQRALAHLGDVVLGAGRAAAIDLGPRLSSASLTLVLDATGPVACGFALYARGSSGSVGFNDSAGIPLE